MDEMYANHANHMESMPKMGTADHKTHSMQMYFTTDLPFTLLFKPWFVDTTGKAVAAFIGCLLFAMLYEACTAIREKLLLRAACRDECPPVILNSDPSPGTSCPSCPVPNPNDSGKHLVQPDGIGENHHLGPFSRLRFRRFNRFCDGLHLLQTFLHMIQMFISYMLMLIVMTYNVYMLVAVLLGFTLGYFIFSRNRPLMLRSPQCCH